jgi:hypothetical protein
MSKQGDLGLGTALLLTSSDAFRVASLGVAWSAWTDEGTE